MSDVLRDVLDELWWSDHSRRVAVRAAWPDLAQFLDDTTAPPTQPVPLWGDGAIRAFPDSFDHRQRPKCGVWDPLLGPCVCGNPAGHSSS